MALSVMIASKQIGTRSWIVIKLRNFGWNLAYGNFFKLCPTTLMTKRGLFFTFWVPIAVPILANLLPSFGVFGDKGTRSFGKESKSPAMLLHNLPYITSTGSKFIVNNHHCTGSKLASAEITISGFHPKTITWNAIMKMQQWWRTQQILAFQLV